MNYYPYYKYDENRGFWVPLLLGGLGGAAIVGASRPRPVYVNPAQKYQSIPSYGYNYYGGYNYNPYYPYYR